MGKKIYKNVTNHDIIVIYIDYPEVDYYTKDDTTREIKEAVLAVVNTIRCEEILSAHESRDRKG